MTIVPLVNFADRFPEWFRKHAGRLLTDTRYRAEYETYARSMPYTQWLQTDVWKHTRRLLLLYLTSCIDCGAERYLEVDHLTYDHVGLEVLYLGDMTVRCSRCHQERHAGLMQTRFQFQPQYTRTWKRPA